MNSISKLIFVLFLFGFQQLNADNSKVKFGKVDPADIKMLVYEPDTSAKAVVLYDSGQTYFDLGSGSLAFRHERIQRIKILTKEGLEYGNFEIPIYGNGTESIAGIKGYTYNVENGDIVKIKLDSDSKHLERTSDYMNTYKITFPNVQPGSVVELKYSITSNQFWRLRGWDFQRSIPVRFSEYDVRIPEFFTYQVQMKGYESFNVADKDVLSYNGMNTNKYYWKAKNMPAFKGEPFMLNEDGFILGVNFELSLINIPGSIYEDFSQSWQSVITELIEDEDLGRLLNTGAFLNDIVDQINAECADDESKIIAAFKFIKDKIKWDDRYAIYANTSLRKVFNDGVGSVAEINLILINLLRKLDVECDPVILSTRSRGMTNFFFPKISVFNYLIVAAKTNGKEVLLDATDKMCSVNDIPFRCLNDKGLKLKKGAVEWVDLSNKNGTKKISIVMDFADLDDITGTVSYSYKDYPAYLYQKRVEDKTEDEIIEEFEEDNDRISVNEYQTKVVEGIEKSIAVSYDVEFSDILENNGDQLFLNPIVLERQMSNPFTLEDRKYPVDFGFSQTEEIIVTIQNLDGYAVETLPQPLRVALPDGAGNFTYMSQSMNGSIQIVCKVEINKPMFVYSEYQYLKEFFNRIVTKQSEMIVLKKV